MQDDGLRKIDMEKMRACYKKINEQVYTEYKRIFPEELVDKTLRSVSLEDIFKKFMKGSDLIEQDYKQYPFLKKYATQIKKPEEQKKKKFSFLIDRILYPTPAETIVLKKYAIPTGETLNYEPFFVPKFALTDMGEEAMTKFLGCIPNESENCYSIIKFLSERRKIPLGFSASDMRDMVVWMTVPGKRDILW